MLTTISSRTMKMGTRTVPQSAPFGSAKIKARKFLVVLGFYEGDRDAAEDLASLIADLERTRNRECDFLLLRRADCRELSSTIKAKLEAKFDRVLMHACRRTDAKSYPHASNQIFYDLVSLMASYSPWKDDFYAFINLETDCVPTRPGWITELTDAWRSAAADGKSAIGHIENNPSTHLNGVAVYAQDMANRVHGRLLGGSPSVTFDIRHGPVILPLAKDTPLIYFKYRQPTITPAELFAPRKDGIVPALYHGVKDSSARDAVRARHITFTNPAAEMASAGIGAAIEMAVKVAEVVSPKRPNVYCYSHKTDSINAAERAAILKLWNEGWTSAGWNPVVLTLREAGQHAQFDDMQTALDRLPHVGDQGEFRNSFNQWLALDTAGGGLIVGIDVLPESLKPETISPDGEPVIFIDAKTVTIVGASMSAPQASAWVSEILKYDAQPEDMREGKPHVSDGIIAARSPVFSKRIRDSIFGTPEIVHFAPFIIGKALVSEAMKAFLAFPKHETQRV